MSSMKWFEGPAWVISLYDDDESLLSNASNFMDLETSVRSSFIVSCFIVDSCKWGLLLFNWFILELFPIEVVEFKPNNWEPWPIKKLLVRIACWEKRLISLGPTPLRKVPTFLLLLWACYTIVFGEPAVNKSGTTLEMRSETTIWISVLIRLGEDDGINSSFGIVYFLA